MRKNSFQPMIDMQYGRFAVMFAEESAAQVIACPESEQFDLYK